MAAESSKQRELQEKSIKARKNELFVGEADDLTGPRKTFRQVLRETPAAPLSKNVKLVLWGSAAPVALLFVASLLRVGNATNVTTPAEPSISLAGTKPALAKPSGEPSATPTAEAPKPDQPGAEAGSKPETPPEQKEKPKKKPKKSKKKTPPKNEETAVAKGDEAPKPDEPKTDETSKPPKKVASSEPDKAPSSESDRDRDRDREKAASGEMEPKSKSKSKSSSSPDDKSDAKTNSSASPGSPAPEKPKRERLFKTKKPPVFTYPKKANEKKDESDKSGANPAAP